MKSELDQVAVSVRSVSKNFRLPHEKSNSIKSSATNLFRKKNRTIDTQHALKDISFDINRGEFFGILGRNGSGKSTMLKILAGIYQPTKGNVHVEGKLVPFIELGVGFNPELTGRENVYLNGALLGFSRQEIAGMYDDIVAFAELEKFMDQKLKNYSSGMQVRLAFSVATRAKADVLLIDEVLAVGDADFQRKCFEYFKKLKAGNTTVIFVTHDMNAVKEYCDRAVLIENSEVVEIGKASKIANMYTRLFVKHDGGVDKRQNLQDKRWGSGEVTIEDVKFTKPTYTEDDDEIEFSYIIRANKDINDIIPGFTIRTTAEENIAGTNSQILEHDRISLKKDQSVKVTWKIANLFNTGTLNISPAVNFDGGNSVADWWDDASSFEVVKKAKTPHLTNSKVVLEVTAVK